MSTETQSGETDQQRPVSAVCEFCGGRIDDHEQCPTRDKGECQP